MSIIPYIYDFEKPLRLMEREFLGPRDFFNMSPFNQAREIFSPSFHNPCETMHEPLEQMSAALNQMALNEIAKITSDDEKFQINVDVQHFSPEEVKVKVVDGHVVVQGKHEEKEDEHGYVTRRFVRRYALPEGCLPDTVESKLSSDGVLTVTAPKVLALPSKGERIVLVKKTGPVSKVPESQEDIN